MPFTFSHPAIVLPFCKIKKIPLSITGLVMGSMVPDFEFLLRLKETNVFAHRFPGILTFSVPFGILLSFIFHHIFRNTIIIHLPRYFRLKFTVFLSFNWTGYFKKHYGLFLISLCIGIASHLFLDAFTHEDGIFVLMNVAFYQTLTVFNQPLPVYVVLQLASSVVGALYVLWFVSNMKNGKDIQPVKKTGPFWLTMIMVFALFFTLRVWIDTAHQTADDLIVAWFGSGVYAFMITCTYFHYATKHNY